MQGVQGLPTWAVALAAIVATGLFVWRYMSLVTTMKEKLGVFKGVAVGAAFIGVMAVVKHNAANHALVLFADVMLALMAGTLPVGKEIRRLSRLTAETGEQQSLSQKDAKMLALVIGVSFCVLLALEYVVL